MSVGSAMADHQMINLTAIQPKSGEPRIHDDTFTQRVYELIRVI